MDSALRYESHIDLSNENNAHTQLVLVTGRDKKVLEVGPASGYITAALRERGCRVTCVEKDPEAAEKAAQFAERMIVADIEEMDFWQAFCEDRFDVVMFGDVLEHLLDPAAVLRRAREYLAAGGYVLASVPNVAHGSVRLSLMRGDFSYTDIGLLDRTHVKFFTRGTLRQLFLDAGLEPRTWRRILVDPCGPEVGLREEDYPPPLVEALRRDPEALTYQFVVEAYAQAARGKRGALSPGPADAAPPVALQELMQLEARRRETEARLAERDAALAERDAALAEKETELSDKQSMLSEMEAALADREETIHRLAQELEGIRGSRGYRLLEAYRRLRRRLSRVRRGSRIFGQKNTED